MKETRRVYAQALWKHSRAFVSGAATGAVGIAFTIHPFVVPAWVWSLLAIASVIWVNLVAFHDLHVSHMAETSAKNDAIANLRAQLDAGVKASSDAKRELDSQL